VESEIVANAFHHANWGTPIAVYFWLVGSSAGSFVISSLGWVFGIKKYKSISFFASNLAICQLLLVPILLVFDLGQALRFTHLFPVITGFWHASAPLAWGTALVASYPVGMAIYSYLIYRHNETWARIFGLIAVFQACGTHWYTGITMALNPARHPNHTAMASILFLVGAFISGIGLLNLILYIRNKFVSGEYKLDPSVIIDLGRLMLYGLLLDAFLVFLEFINPGTMTIGQLYIFTNNSDTTFAADGANLLQFNLPAGASTLDVQNAVLDQDYFRNADGFGALWQVQPGASGGQILFSFQLPYDEALDYSQVMHFPVTSVNVLVSDLNVSLSGPNLLDLGAQNFQGQTFQNFSLSGLAAGDTLNFEVTGAAGTGGTAGEPAVAVGDSTGLAIGLGALAVALLGIGVWLYRRPARPDPARLREDLLQALVELDDAYEAGEVARDDYLAERAQLKADLVKVWETNGN